MHLTFKPLHGIGSETLSLKLVYKHGSYITAQAEYVDINTREENTISLNALKCYTYNHKGYRKGRPKILKDLNDVSTSVNFKTGQIVCNEIEASKKHYVLTGYEVNASRTNHAC